MDIYDSEFDAEMCLPYKWREPTEKNIRDDT